MKMRLFKSVLTTMSITSFLMSCGQIQNPSENTQKRSQRVETPSSTTASSPQGLPQGAVIAVPVNANGEELSDQAQLKLLPIASQDLSDQAIVSSFNQGKSPDQDVNELDQTSSTESFHGWGRYRSYGRYYNYNNGYNNGFGYGRFNQGCNHYRFFQPTYYYAGTPYNWQYQSAYSGSGMNYYYYRQGPWGQTAYGQSAYNTTYGTTGGFPVQPIGYLN